jgi:hypothetical protein
MEGELSISLEREPDFFAAAAVEGPRHHTVVARDTDSGRIVGLGSRSARRCYLNGRRTWLPYLGALRVDRAWRGNLRSMVQAYDFCRSLQAPDETPFCLTSIVADNRRARRLLEAGLPGMPVYRRAADMVTLAVPVRGRGSSSADARVESGDPSSLGEVEKLLADFGRRRQFHPVWTRADLVSRELTPGLEAGDFFFVMERGRAVACAALWDQREFKQAVVRGYSRRIAALRPLANLAAPLLALPRIPPVGGQVQSAFLSHLAVEEGREELLPALVAAARSAARRRGIECLLLGVAADGPLHSAVRGAFPARAYRSVLYLVHWDDEGAAAVGGLDDRVTHVEVATL